MSSDLVPDVDPVTENESRANTANRAFCFTLNNPTPDDELIISSLSANPWPKLLQFVCQLEKGEQGTPHYQGYVRFECVQRFKHVCKLLGGRARLVPAGGSSWKNYLYCTKSDGRIGEPIVIGEFSPPKPKSGGYSSRAQVLKLLQENPVASVSELISQGALEVLVSRPGFLGIARGYLRGNARRDGVLVYYFYGAPGCGKSRLADHMFPNAYRKPPGKWWDGYDGESEVVIDDLDINDIPFGDLLRVLDRYPLRIEVKGGFVPLAATTFCITSNFRPNEVYPCVKPGRMRALLRRITQFWDFDSMSIYTGDTVLDSTPTFLRSFVKPWETVTDSFGSLTVTDMVVDEPPLLPVTPEFFDLDVE